MYSNTRALTISHAVLPRASLWRDASLVLGGTVLIALSALVTIPLYGQGLAHPVATAIAQMYASFGIPLPNTPVPITAQTFAVLLVGALLGGRLGFLCMLAYLAEGLAGLPVFSMGRNAWSPTSVGLPLIVGPTAGYLWSYPLAAFVVGWLAQRGWDRRFATTALAMLLGNVVIYLIGVPFLGLYVTQSNAIAAGMLPFIPGDVIKLLLAALLLPSAWVLVRRLGLDR